MTKILSATGFLLLQDKRILLVEDEALVAILIEDELLDAGARLFGPAASVEEALRLLDATVQDGGLDAAVVDLNLNGESGVLVADALAHRAVPFLFMTGYSDGLHHGKHAATLTLQKPFAPHDLILAVARLVRPETVAA